MKKIHKATEKIEDSMTKLNVNKNNEDIRIKKRYIN